MKKLKFSIVIILVFFSFITTAQVKDKTNYFLLASGTNFLLSDGAFSGKLIEEPHIGTTINANDEALAGNTVGLELRTGYMFDRFGVMLGGGFNANDDFDRQTFFIKAGPAVQVSGFLRLYALGGLLNGSPSWLLSEGESLTANFGIEIGGDGALYIEYGACFWDSEFYYSRLLTESDISLDDPFRSHFISIGYRADF